MHSVRQRSRDFSKRWEEWMRAKRTKSIFWWGMKTKHKILWCFSERPDLSGGSRETKSKLLSKSYFILIFLLLWFFSVISSISCFSFLGETRSKRHHLSRNIPEVFLKISLKRSPEKWELTNLQVNLVTLRRKQKINFTSNFDFESSLLYPFLVAHKSAPWIEFLINIIVIPNFLILLLTEKSKNRFADDFKRRWSMLHGRAKKLRDTESCDPVYFVCWSLDSNIFTLFSDNWWITDDFLWS